jgi:hypothetical protein
MSRHISCPSRHMSRHMPRHFTWSNSSTHALPRDNTDQVFYYVCQYTLCICTCSPRTCLDIYPVCPDICRDIRRDIFHGQTAAPMLCHVIIQTKYFITCVNTRCVFAHVRLGHVSTYILSVPTYVATYGMVKYSRILAHQACEHAWDRSSWGQELAPAQERVGRVHSAGTQGEGGKNRCQKGNGKGLSGSSSGCCTTSSF